jgi:sugar phosphate isomerase/epimerase
MTENKFSKSKAAVSLPQYWGMAGVFPGELELWRGDEWANQRRFVAEQGFSGGAVSVSDLTDPGRRSLLRSLAESHGQRQSVHLGLDYREPAAATRARLDAEVSTLLNFRREVPLICVAVVVTGNGHRFDRAVPLARQLERLNAVLAPVAARCRDAGLPAAIENHGDYYVSDLVELCGRTPGLEILLDTGNCFLIGERPETLPAEAFPMVCATHWKDHFVKPNPHTLHFELTGATLGAGHVGLEALFNRLCALHPDPAGIRMMIEWVPDPQRDARACFTDSKKHLEKISGGLFPAGKRGQA